MSLFGGVLFLVAATVSQRAYDEVYRPQFHFTSATNWLNDPNGLVFYKGTYHLFFQHNPSSVQWGNMTWGHATSPDLVHWTQTVDAIRPDPLGTIFSGSAVVDTGNTGGFQAGKDKALVALYCCAGGTSPESKGQPFTQCLAYSQDAGKTWLKYADNPVVPHIAGENRDPKVVWFEPKREWVMALFLDGSDYALLTSPDLKQWKQVQRFTFPGQSECPDFFPMRVEGTQDTKWVFVSANGTYLVGGFDGDHFTPEQKGLKMDEGANYYAVQTYSDIPSRDGRRIQIAWMNGGNYPGMPFNQQMSFPCALTLHQTPDGLRIHRNPVKEIASLVDSSKRIGSTTMPADSNILDGEQGDLWDLACEFRVGAATQIELGFRGTLVTYDVASESLKWGDHHMRIPLHEGRLKLRALIDRTSFEIFGNDGEASFSCCYLPKVEDHSIALVARGGSARLVRIDLRRLRSAWEH